MMNRRRLLFPLLLASMALTSSCDAEPSFEDGLPGPAAPGEWMDILPGGDTLCARGTEYRFITRGGDPTKIIIDFQGGGACWNAETCGFAGALFSERTGSAAQFEAAIAGGEFGGLFDPDTEFGDWTIVHVPYCTGDIHWGNATVDYGDGVTIEHRGYVNAQAALDWVYTRFPEASQILVSGCSAGAYGAALHSAYVQDHYPEAQVSVLADSGAGIITDDFLEQSLPNWNAEGALPPFIPGLQRPLTELSLTDLYIQVGQHFPQMRLAQTGTQFDQDQIFFYTAMGGNSEDWPGRYRDSLARIDDELDNFTAFVPPGSVHCVTIYDFFNTREVDGVRLADWTADLVEGESIPPTVACEGAGCCSDPVCDACGDSTEGHCQFCALWPPTWSECAE